MKKIVLPRMSHVGFSKVLVGSLLFLLFWLTAAHTLDPDFGWRVRTGEWILAHRALPHQDLFSFTMPDYPWIEHAWLADVFFAWASRHLAYVVLAGIMAFLMAAPFLWWLLGVANGVELFFVALAALSLFRVAMVRAQIFSTFLFFVVWLLLERIPKRPWIAAFLPPIFFVWSMVHGGFLAGFLVVGLTLGVRFFHEMKMGIFRAHVKALLLGFLGSILLLPLNPYGLALFGEIFRNVSSRYNIFILEWQPFGAIFDLPMLVMAALAGFFAIQYRKKLPLERAVPFLVFFCAAMMSLRNWPFFVLVALPVFILCSRMLLEDVRFQKDSPRFTAGVRVIALCLIFSFSWWVWRLAPWHSEKDTAYPSGVLTLLRQLPGDTHLFNDYGWGGWLILNAPHLKTFIDGRMPYWDYQGESVMREYVDVYLGKKSVKDLVARHSLNAALVRKITPAPKSKVGQGFDVEVQKLAERMIDKKTKLELGNMGVLQNLTYLSGAHLVNFPEAFRDLGWKVAWEDNSSVLLLAPSWDGFAQK